MGAGLLVKRRPSGSPGKPAERLLALQFALGIGGIGAGRLERLDRVLQRHLADRPEITRARIQAECLGYAPVPLTGRRGINRTPIRA